MDANLLKAYQLFNNINNTDFSMGKKASDKRIKSQSRIILIAKNLGMQVLAEGVETKEQYTYLKAKNCDEIQGYYFYKPMPMDEIETIMSEASS
jgi:EAL domain-containing protein (putative c-di-GMP-specific phosphodiesterase class I)